MCKKYCAPGHGPPRHTLAAWEKIMGAAHSTRTWKENVLHARPDVPRCCYKRPPPYGPGAPL